MAKCKTCEGTRMCVVCDGEGRVSTGLLGLFYKKCPVCAGKKLCSTCHGTGRS